MFQWRANAQMRLFACLGWRESALFCSSIHFRMSTLSKPKHTFQTIITNALLYVLLLLLFCLLLLLLLLLLFSFIYVFFFFFFLFFFFLFFFCFFLFCGSFLFCLLHLYYLHTMALLTNKYPYSTISLCANNILLTALALTFQSI